MLWHVKYVFSVVYVIISGREVLQAIRCALVRSTCERARYVEIFGHGVAGVPVQLHVSARALVGVDDVLITRS